MDVHYVTLAPADGSSFAERRLALDHGGGRVVLGRAAPKGEQPSFTNGLFDFKVLSSTHAELWCDNGKVYVRDLGSSNGTFLNGQRLSSTHTVSEPWELHSGDELQLGREVFIAKSGKVHRNVIARVHTSVSMDGGGSDAQGNVPVSPPPHGDSSSDRLTVETVNDTGRYKEPDALPDSIAAKPARLDSRRSSRASLVGRLSFSLDSSSEAPLEGSSEWRSGVDGTAAVLGDWDTPAIDGEHAHASSDDNAAGEGQNANSQPRETRVTGEFEGLNIAESLGKDDFEASFDGKTAGSAVDAGPRMTALEDIGFAAPQMANSPSSLTAHEENPGESQWGWNEVGDGSLVAQDGKEWIHDDRPIGSGAEEIGTIAEALREGVTQERLTDVPGAKICRDNSAACVGALDALEGHEDYDEQFEATPESHQSNDPQGWSNRWQPENVEKDTSVSDCLDARNAPPMGDIHGGSLDVIDASVRLCENSATALAGDAGKGWDVDDAGDGWSTELELAESSHRVLYGKEDGVAIVRSGGSPVRGKVSDAENVNLTSLEKNSDSGWDFEDEGWSAPGDSWRDNNSEGVDNEADVRTAEIVAGDNKITTVERQFDSNESELIDTREADLYHVARPMAAGRDPSNCERNLEDSDGWVSGAGNSSTFSAEAAVDVDMFDRDTRRGTSVANRSRATRDATDSVINAGQSCSESANKKDGWGNSFVSFLSAVASVNAVTPPREAVSPLAEALSALKKNINPAPAGAKPTSLIAPGVGNGKHENHSETIGAGSGKKEKSLCIEDKYIRQKTNDTKMLVAVATQDITEQHYPLENKLFEERHVPYQHAQERAKRSVDTENEEAVAAERPGSSPIVHRSEDKSSSLALRQYVEAYMSKVERRLGAILEMIESTTVKLQRQEQCILSIRLYFGDCKRQMQEDESNIHELEEALESMSKEKMGNADRANAFEVELLALKNELSKAMDRKLGDIDNARSTAALAIEKAARADALLADLKCRVADSDQTIQQLERQLQEESHRRNEAVHEREEATARARQAESQIRTLESQLRETQHHLESQLEEERRSRIDLSQRAAESATRAQEAESQTRSLERQLRESQQHLQQKYSEASQIAADSAELKEDLADLRARITAVDADREALREAVAAREVALDQANSQIRAHSSRLASNVISSEELAEAQKSEKRAIERATKLEAKVAEQEEKLRKMEARLRDYTSADITNPQLEAAELQIKQWANDLARVTEENASLALKCAAAARERRQLNSERIAIEKRAEEELAQAKDAIEDAERRANESQQREAASMRQLEAMRIEIHAMRVALDSAQESARQAAAAADESRMNAIVADMDAEKARLGDALTVAQEQHNASQAACEKLRLQLRLAEERLAGVHRPSAVSNGHWLIVIGCLIAAALATAIAAQLIWSPVATVASTVPRQDYAGVFHAE